MKKTTVYDKLKNMAIVALRRERMYRNGRIDQIVAEVTQLKRDLKVASVIG